MDAAERAALAARHALAGAGVLVWALDDRWQSYTTTPFVLAVGLAVSLATLTGAFLLFRR